MQYGYRKTTSASFEEAVESIKAALAQEGFGVLTEIDVKKTMKEKLGEEYTPYLILGACNPQFAHKALQAEKEIGLLLPCNVLVYEDAGAVHIAAILPTAAMSVVENDTLAAIAGEVEARLKRAVDAAAA